MSDAIREFVHILDLKFPDAVGVLVSRKYRVTFQQEMDGGWHPVMVHVWVKSYGEPRGDHWRSFRYGVHSEKARIVIDHATCNSFTRKSARA